MAPSVGDRVAAAPPGRIRALVSCFIAAWVLWQIAVPLAYYIHDYQTGEVQEDQRFTWRMFSQVWLQQRGCNIEAFDLMARPDGAAPAAVRRLDLHRQLESIWVEQLREGRRQVAEKFLRTQCDRDASVVQAEVMRTCPIARGSRLPELNLRLACRATVPSTSGPSPR